MTWALCLCIGMCSGFLAGMLGVGGGTVIVPALILAARPLGIGADDAPTVAMATSLAIVIPTSISSARAHAARGSIDWHAFRRLAPGIAAGALAGTLAACALGGRWPLAVFIGFALLATRQLLARAPAESAPLRPAAPPGPARLARHGLAIGLLSSLAGVGGGLLSVPLLSHYLPLQRAIGTAAALGLPLAAAGLGGYLLAGHPVRCTAGCIGAVFVPGACAVSLAAIAAAPLGARLAHRLPVRWLRRAFAALLLLACADLAAELLR
jgi:uncharacterized membrane protein YfcA